MTVRRSTAALLTALSLLLGAGCGGSGGAPTPDETSDALYQRAVELNKQGQKGEALTAFRKVIERRGEAGAPESHLEAASLYLNWAKDPAEAYHHFGQYLELHPTGTKADMVRGQRDAARRELVRTSMFPGGEQAMGAGSGENIEQLRRRVQELEAEIQTLRGASGVPVVRPPPVIALSDERPAPESVASLEAQPSETRATSGSPFVRTFNSGASPVRPPPVPAATRAAPAASGANTRPAPTSTVVTSTERTAAAPTRPGAPQRPGPGSSGRAAYTVTGADKSLWAVARRYYGAKPTTAQVQGIYLANRDIMRSDSDLRPGMVLRIP